MFAPRQGATAPGGRRRADPGRDATRARDTDCRDAPEHYGRHRADQRRRDARLECPQLVRAADEHHLHRGHTAAQLVRRRKRDGHRPDVHAEHVREPATARAALESGNDFERPKTIIAAPKIATTDSSVRPALPRIGRWVRRMPAASAPTAGELRRMPRPTGPTLRMSLANKRQQGHRAAEEDGEEVEAYGAEQHRRAADEARACEQRLAAGRRLQ